MGKRHRRRSTKYQTTDVQDIASPAVPNVAVVLFLEKLVFYGIRSGLVLLLNEKLHWSREDAVIAFHMLMFVHYFSGFVESFLEHAMTAYRLVFLKP